MFDRRRNYLPGAKAGLNNQTTARIAYFRFRCGGPPPPNAIAMYQNCDCYHVYVVRTCMAIFLFIGHAQEKSTEKMW